MEHPPAQDEGHEENAAVTQDLQPLFGGCLQFAQLELVGPELFDGLEGGDFAALDEHRAFAKRHDRGRDGPGGLGAEFVGHALVIGKVRNHPRAQETDKQFAGWRLAT